LYVTFVVPCGKAVLLLKEELENKTVDEMAQLSVTDKVPNDATDVHTPAAVGRSRLEGHTRTGDSRSVTVTVKLHAALLAEESLAQYVTVLTPRGNCDVEARDGV